MVSENPSVRSRWPRICFVLWLLAISIGAAALWAHNARAGATRPAPADIPSGLSFTPPAGKSLLLMTVHPNCPCTRASIAELGEIVAAHPDSLAVYVLFSAPADMPTDPATSDMWKTVAGTHGLTPIRDPDTRMADALHATISGQVFLYDPAGRLCFSGGITPSRGHEGDSPGRRAIESYLLTGMPLIRHAAVFGCTLH